MKYKIKGDFNSGLKVYSESSLIMFSEVTRRWFSPDLTKVYTKNNDLLITIKQKGFFSSSYQIQFQNSELIDQINSINNSTLSFSDDKRIEFKSKWSSLLMDPYFRIFYNNYEIGIVKLKRIAINLDFTLIIKENFEHLTYLFIFFLITQSNKDYD
ncbi:hypothetical protein [Aestuariivivens marinum]|uniref:hypothetical protein n=1 Tax=Aestuariivivens marinum TaxID=2913555 RepID=UPI001F59816C|nr:hypothetical protein [Aestuariivivens marinum]